jgi:N-acetylglucosamine kinase-like BadF-type ATPase
MKLFLGIDQGGTKTYAAVCDESGIIHGVGKAAGLTTVYFADENEQYLNNIRQAARDALHQAGASFNDVQGVCGCLNGADWDFEYPLLAEKLKKAVDATSAPIILNDCIGSMRGGTGNAECAVVCAGTGLNAAVQREDGEMVIYGYFIDENDQGGNALGRAALRKVYDAYYGLCEKTVLTDMVMEFTGRSSALTLLTDCSMGDYYIEPKVLVPLILKAYRLEDAETVALIDEFSYSVSRYVTAGLIRLGMENRPVEVVFSGSVFKDNGTLVADRIFSYIQKKAPHVKKINACYEPVCGTLLTLLDRHYNRPLPESVMRAFNKSAEAYDLLRNLSLTLVESQPSLYK